MSWGQKCAGTRSQPGSTDGQREQEAELRLPPTLPAFSSPPPRHTAVSGTTHRAHTGLRPIAPQDSRLQQPPCSSRANLPEIAAAISRRLRAGSPASIPPPPWVQMRNPQPGGVSPLPLLTRLDGSSLDLGPKVWIPEPTHGSEH